MNKIEKFLRKLRAQEQEALLLLLQQLRKDYKKIPDLKKLKGTKDLFRVRLGRYRIIFRADKHIEIIKITKRDERTYENLS